MKNVTECMIIFISKHIDKRCDFSRLLGTPTRRRTEREASLLAFERRDEGESDLAGCKDSLGSR